MITEKISKFISSLQNVLEKSELTPTSLNIENTREIKKIFEISTDLSQIDAWADGIPDQDPDRTMFLFTRLIPYFDSGILFEKSFHEKKPIWLSRSAFQEGTFYPFPRNNPLLKSNLPERPLSDIFKIKSKEIVSDLQAFGFLEKDQLPIAFRNHPDYYFVVISSLPEVWLKPHLEKIHQQTLKLCGEIL